MSKGSIVIVEDEFFVAKHIKRIVSNQGFEVAAVYHSAEDFLKLKSYDFDAALVDILLSGKKTGIDVAQVLQAQNKPFIFLTANQDEKTLSKATMLVPQAYITKPFKTIDVEAALHILAAKLPQKLSIKGAYGEEYISPNEIYFIKADGSYTEIHCSKGKIVQRKLMKDFEDVLPDYFQRVHRSYLVNENFIDSKSRKFLVVKGQHVPVSRNYKNE